METIKKLTESEESLERSGLCKHLELRVEPGRIFRKRYPVIEIDERLPAAKKNVKRPYCRLTGDYCVGLTPRLGFLDPGYVDLTLMERCPSQPKKEK